MFDPTDWRSQVEARGQIADLARNAISNSALSNPITHTRGWKKLKASADSEQTIIARLVEEVKLIKVQISSINDVLSTSIPQSTSVNSYKEIKLSDFLVVPGGRGQSEVVGRK